MLFSCKDWSNFNNENNCSCEFIMENEIPSYNGIPLTNDRDTLELISQKIKESDTVIVRFLNQFNDDRAALMCDNEVLFSKSLKTDFSLSIAESFFLSKNSIGKKKIKLKVNSNDSCLFQLNNNFKYIDVYYTPMLSKKIEIRFSNSILSFS